MAGKGARNVEIHVGLGAAQVFVAARSNVAGRGAFRAR